MTLLIIAILIVFGIQSLGWFLYIIDTSIAQQMVFLSYGTPVGFDILYLLFGAVVFVIGFFLVSKQYSANQEYDFLGRMQKNHGLVMGVGPVLSVFFILFTGVTSIPERQGYHAIGFDFLPSFLVSVSGIFGLLSVPMLGFSYAKGGRALKLLSIMLLLALCVCYFSKASRVLAFAPLAFFGMAYAVSGRGRLGLGLGMACAPFFIHIALASRAQPIQGFMPQLEYLIYGMELSFGKVLWSFLTSLAGPYFIFSETLAVSYWQNWSDLSVSLNPDIGVRAGWYEVYSFYRINRFVPYSALGEVFSFSILLGGAFCMLLGGLLARIDLRLRRKELVGYFLLAIFLYACILIPQYNLRTVMRFIYLVVFIDLVVALVDYFRRISVKKLVINEQEKIG